MRATGLTTLEPAKGCEELARHFENHGILNYMLAPEPNFFIIGAPKCGTTTLHAWLSQHPDVYMPKLKELRFYSDSELFHTIGFDGYLDKFFSAVEEETAIGEATPAYLQNAETVIPRMKATLAQPEELRFIVIFRNPADRAFSHFLHARRLETESRNFEKTVFDNASGALNRNCVFVRESLYSRAVETWLNNFDRRQFYFARLEDMNSGAIREDIARFLQILPDELTSEIKAANVQATMRSKAIARFMARDSLPKMLVKYLLPPVPRNRLRLMITNLNTRTSSDRQLLNPRTRTAMLHAFSDDIIRLEQLTDLDLRDWKVGTPVVTTKR